MSHSREGLGQQPNVDLPPNRELSVEDLDRFKADANLMLGSTGFSVRIEPNIQSCAAFDHQAKVVLINPELLLKKGLTLEGLRYVFAHEIGHFVQLLSDPEAYQKSFEEADRRAQPWPQESRAQVRRLWGRFYNVFLDFHANATVNYRSMWTQGSREHPSRSLYEKLAPADLQGSPKTEQFLFSLLRRAMLGSETPVYIDADVAAILEAPVRYFGTDYSSLYDFAVANFFNADTTLNLLLHDLDRVLAPMFEKLIKIDSESEGNESGQTKLDEADRPVDLDGSDMDPEEAKKLVEDIKRSRESASEATARKDRERFRDRMMDKGFDEDEVRIMQEIKDQVNDVYMSLVDLWQVFTRVSQVINHATVTRFRNGKVVDVSEVVAQIDKLETDPGALKVFLRELPEAIEDRRPKLIELYLVLDLSGSMDDRKRRAVQESAYALAQSLIKFRQDQAFLAGSEDDSIKINLRLLGFGSTTEDLLDRLGTEERAGEIQNYETLERRLWQAVLAIGKRDLVGTADAPALQAALDEIQSHQGKFAEGDRVSVLVEVTDGETETADASAALVRQLNSMPSTHARAIQITGGTGRDTPLSEGEAFDPNDFKPSGVFEDVWGKDGLRLSDIQSLRALMLRILFTALRSEQE